MKYVCIYLLYFQNVWEYVPNAILLNELQGSLEKKMLKSINENIV